MSADGGKEDWGLAAEEQARALGIPEGSSSRPIVGRGRGRGFKTGSDTTAPGATPQGPSYQLIHGWQPSEETIADISAFVASARATNGATSAAGASSDAAVNEESGDPGKVAAEASLLSKLVRTKLVPTKADLEVLQKDPNSPLFSVKSFTNLKLKPMLLKGIYNMGFNAPSKIQETALPLLLSDPNVKLTHVLTPSSPQNMIAQSQSGTGKTAAFVLTMLSRVNPSDLWPQCICLSPTYELALQTGEVTKQMGKFMEDIKVGFAVRGEKVERNQLAPYHIVIGTPGTLLDWCHKWKAIDLSRIIVFVLDEADVMVATHGHQDQSLKIKKHAPEATCQMLLFSATYDETVMNFAMRIVKNPNVIRLRREEESLENVKQLYIECSNDEEKFESLSNIYGSITVGQSMIFCQTKKKASWLAEKMTREGHAVALLSGELQVEQRAAVINRFREGKERVLITTNLSSRGIDIEQVTLVVNFDLPLDAFGKVDCETYLHRIGRTGRFGKSGLAVNMVDGTMSKNNLKVIEKHFGRPIEKLNAEDIDEIVKLAE